MIFRVFLAIFFGLLFAYDTFTRFDGKIGSENRAGEAGRYQPYISNGNLLIILLVLLLGISIWELGLSEAVTRLFSGLIGIFLDLSFYYAVLLFLLPVIRKHISARSCALLWTMPNLLYITMGYSNPYDPRWVLSLPSLTGIFWVWFLGFAGVLVWHIGSHLHLRRQLLRSAEPVTDPVILQVWAAELKNLGVEKPKFRLLWAKVSTPLSIGLFQRSTRVLLPKKDYTEAELHLIFRHELVHVCREDASAKFFLVFCTAMCWWNPLLWIAIQKSRDDLELSCDETVLLDAQEGTRKAYAHLILDHAAEDRGFTSCLSARAESLRYRLKNIVKPRKRRSGALLVGVFCGILMLFGGSLTVAYGSAHLELPKVPIGIQLYEDGKTYSMDCPDPEGLREYLTGLDLQHLNRLVDSKGTELNLVYQKDGTAHVLTISRNYVKFSALRDRHAETYYGDVDWDTLMGFLDIHPRLDFLLLPQNTELTASLVDLECIENGSPVATDYIPESRVSGAFGHAVYEEAQLSFSHALARPFSVEIQTEQGTKGLSQSDLEDPWVLPLEPESAVYTIHADLEAPNHRLYRAVFQFEIQIRSEDERPPDGPIA